MRKFRVFYQQERERLFAYLIRNTGDYYLAGDILQESFTRYLEKYGSRRPSPALLYTIARNALIDGYRKQGRDTPLFEEPAHPQHNPEAHLAVREDAHTLYGFSKPADRELFRHLLKVNGVGARLALTILSGMEPVQFVQCVRAGDTDSLVRLPGIGKKTAERLVMELRDRLEKEPAITAIPSVDPAVAVPLNPVEDAVSALVGLGYKPQEASRMVRAVDASELSSEEIIRQALQSVVQ